MSEVRQDPTTKEWVIIANERIKRPHHLVKRKRKSNLPPYEPSCPFCPGNEHRSEEILRYPPAPAERSLPWRVRVVRNKYPILTNETCTQTGQGTGFFTKMNGIGSHEVIIETPVHNRPIPLMEADEVQDLLTVYRERYRELMKDTRIRLIIIFKNHGRGAGTSLAHPHSQLVATPVAPAEVSRQLEVAAAHYHNTGHCLYRDIIDHELEAGERIVTDSERFVVFHPFASRLPFETWIVPRREQASFGNASTEDLASLAQVMRATLLRLYTLLNDPDINYVIHTAPVGDESEKYFRWHIRIMPRLTAIAGFEIGSGMYISIAYPEQTAALIRQLKV